MWMCFIPLQKNLHLCVDWVHLLILLFHYGVNWGEVILWWDKRKPLRLSQAQRTFQVRGAVDCSRTNGRHIGEVSHLVANGLSLMWQSWCKRALQWPGVFRRITPLPENCVTREVGTEWSYAHFSKTDSRSGSCVGWITRYRRLKGTKTNPNFLKVVCVPGHLRFLETVDDECAILALATSLIPSSEARIKKGNAS